MLIKRNYSFIVDKEKDSEDGKLRLRIKWDNNKNIVAFGVGYRVSLDKWSKETQRCKNNTTHGKKKVMANLINRTIQRYENIVEQVFAEFERQEIMPTKEQYKNAFNAAIGKKVVVQDDNNLFAVLDKFVADVGTTNTWTHATYEKFAAMKNKLQDFNSDATFDFFDEQGLNDYIAYLRDVKDMKNTTILKQLDFLKWFLRWASQRGYSTQTAFQTFAPKLKKTDKKVIFLDWEELMTVYNFEFSDEKPSLPLVRDVFCFCCFTSLRYSDVANLKRSDVYENHIEVTTVKTADSLRIELNDYSRSILEKYKGVTFANDLALPVTSNQRMNDHLKEMGEVCDIDTPIRETYYKGNQRYDEVYPKWQLLSTHAGRRTFICNALMMGIPVNVVMKWTGHSDYKAMKPYIDVADKAKEEAMSLFNKKVPDIKKGD